MLRWIVLAVVVVVLTGVATFLSVNAPDSESLAIPSVPVARGPQPKVEVVEPLTYEFGTMPQLATGTRTWEFKNVGDGDLELWFESSTCSCTVAKLKKPDGEKPRLVVKPKQSTTIDLEWQTKLFHDEYRKGADIGTNDPQRPIVPIYVHGMVNPPVVVYPQETMAFNNISNEEPHSLSIAVFSVDRPDLKITKLTTSRPEFLVGSVKPLSANDCKNLKIKSGHQVTVEVKPGMPLGRFLDDLVITTDHPHRSEIKVAISGHATGPIGHIPERVRMSSVSSRKGASSTMTLLVRGARPTTFTVAFKPDQILVDVEPDDTSTQKGRYKMTVTVPPGTPAGAVDGDIILKTDHPNAAEIRIPVSILISSSAG